MRKKVSSGSCIKDAKSLLAGDKPDAEDTAFDVMVLHVTPSCPSLLSPITLQALVQCGQPHCYTHILQWLKTEKAHPLLVDIVTYLVALIPNPSTQRLREIFNTAKEQQSRATLYALSHVVNK